MMIEIKKKLSNQEGINFGHHGLGLGPGPVLRYLAVLCEENHDGGGNVDDGRRRGPERLQLGQVGLVQGVQGLLSGLQSW
jgi:hypothetical protein